MPFDPLRAKRFNLWGMASTLRDGLNVDENSPLAKVYDRIVARNNAGQEPVFYPCEKDLKELWDSLKMDRRIKKVESDSSLDSKNSVAYSPDSLHRALRDAVTVPEKKKVEKKKFQKKTVFVNNARVIDSKEVEKQKNLKAWGGSHFFVLYEAFEEQFKGTGKKNYLKVLADGAPDVPYHGYELKK